MDDPAAALFGALDRELWLVTAAGSDGRRGGLIATFVGQASIAAGMPRVVVGLANAHFTRALVEEGRAFALHLIGEDQVDWVWRFGLQSGRDVDKFAGLTATAGRSGAPMLAEAPGRLDCRVEAGFETGDRTLYLAEVLDAEWSSRPFLTVQGMLRRASPERRGQLREQFERDAARDARAIAAWRGAR